MGPADDRDLIPLRASFDVVRRGYDRAQVDGRIEELTADLQITAADRDASAAQVAELARQLDEARHELDDALAQVHRLSAPPDTVEGMSERLQRMLRLAQDEAAEITARAEAAAARTRADAEAEVRDLRTCYDDMINEAKRRRAEMEAEHQRVMGEARRAAERILAEARQHAEELDARAAEHRKQVDEDFEITMSARRTETVRELTELDRTSRAEAQQRVADATEKARTLVAEATEKARALVADAEQCAAARETEATRRVEELRAVRKKVAEQLTSAHTTLRDAFAQLDPLPVEKAGTAAAGRAETASGAERDGEASADRQRAEAGRR